MKKWEGHRISKKGTSELQKGKITVGVILPKCDALRDEKCAATLLKLTLLHACFSRFLNCRNGTKSCNTPLT